MEASSKEQRGTDDMMNEDKRKEAQRRLEDEERVRRLREGGETMKAQLAMEEAERSSQGVEGRNYLTPQEQKRRETLESKGPYKGYGEDQQAQMAMWETQRRGEERVSREGGAGTPQRNLTREEMMKTGSDQVGYPAGSGSYYSETFEKPTGTTGPESSFGRTERTPGGRGQQAEMPMREGEVSSSRNLSKEEMRRTGSDQVNYPAGGGSYYSETFEKPTGTAGPESSFGRTERMPSGRQYAEGGASERQVQESRMGARMGPETQKPGTMGQATEAVKEKGGAAMERGKEYGNVAMAKGKEVGSTVVSKTKDVTSQISSRAREFNESNRAEDIASRAGEGLGKAIRKTVSVAREISSGFRRGLGRDEESRRERETSGEAPRQETTIEREEYTRQAPGVEEKHYQELKKRENQ